MQSHRAHHRSGTGVQPAPSVQREQPDEPAAPSTPAVADEGAGDSGVASEGAETQQSAHHETPQSAPDQTTVTQSPASTATHRSNKQSGGALLAVAVPALAALAGGVFWALRSRKRGAPSSAPTKEPARTGTKSSASKLSSPAGRAAAKAARKAAAASNAAPKPAATEDLPRDQDAEPQLPRDPTPEPIDPDTLTIVVAPLELHPPPNPPPPLPTLPLYGQEFAVSEDVDVAGVQTTYGVDDWAQHYTAATATAPAVARAVAAGARGSCKVAVQTAGLDLVGPAFGNVTNKARVSGGGATGAAVAVAQGTVAFALAPDTAGEVRNPAACAGVCAYRPSPGVLGGARGDSAGNSVAGNMCVLAADPGYLLRVAQVLGAPGSANIKGEILQFVVAQDLFDICAPELQPAILALKKAILKWAGSDQAGAVQLVKFLSNHVDTWQALQPGEPLSQGYGYREGESVRIHDFLEAALVAVDILRAEDLHARAGGIAAAANAARQPATPASSSTPQPGTAPANDSNAQNPQAVADSNGTGPASNGNTHEGQPLAEQQQQGNEQARAENGDASGVAGTQQEGRAEQHTQQSSTFKALVDSVADNDNTHAANTKANSDPAAAPAPAQQGGNATGTSQVPGADDKGGEQPTAAGEGETPAAAADAATDPAADPVLPPRPSAAQLAAAHALAADVADCLKATVKPDVLMVVPALPFAPPLRRSDDPMEFVMFGKLTQAFHALATLGSCPTVTLPVGELRDGSPVAISVMAVYRYDQRLLAVAQKMLPMIHESFEAVKQEITQMAMQRAREGPQGTDTAVTTATTAPGPASNTPATSTTSASQPDKRASSAGGARSEAQAAAPAGAPAPKARAAPPAVDPKKAEKAEKAKAKGNEFYQAGKYAEAINEYTKAISLNPTSHVYLSNRAMACIKLFRFEQAEEDINNVLKFDLSEKDKAKALLRRATARDALQKYDGAEQDLKAVLSLEPHNKQAREDVRALRQHKTEMAESQAALISQMRLQQQAAMQQGLPPGAGALPPGAPQLPPGLDPSMFPPGFFGPDGLPAEEYAQGYQ